MTSASNRPFALTMLLLWSFVTFPAKADWIPVSAPGIVNIPAEREEPQVATNGRGYVAVWRDSRHQGGVIKYARIEEDGTVLDPTGVQVPSWFTTSDGAVVWNGTRYLVFYRDPSAVYVFSLFEDGTTTAPRLVGQASASTRIASNGSSTLLVNDDRTVLLLGDDGSILRRLSSPVSPTGAAVASNGRDYLIAGVANGHLVTQRISASGVSDSYLVHSATGHHYSLASDGDHYLLVTADDKVRATVLDADGSEINPWFDLTEALPYEALTKAVWREGEYLVLYANQGSEVSAIRVAQSGAPRDAIPPFGRTSWTSGGGQCYCSMAAQRNGSGAVLWLDAPVPKVNFALFDDMSIARRAPFTSRQILSRTVGWQTQPKLVAARDTALTGWIEETNDGNLLRVAVAGGKPLAIHATTTIGPIRYRYDPYDLAFDGTLLWVAWTDGDFVRVRRYLPSLQPFDTRSFIIANNSDFIAIALSPDGGALVAEGNRVHLLRGDGSGITKQSTIALSPSGAYLSDFHVVWNGTEYVVVYADNESLGVYGIYTATLRAMRVSQDGTPLDASPVTVNDQSIYGLQNLDVVPNHGDIAVIWTTGNQTWGAITGRSPRLLLNGWHGFVTPRGDGYLAIVDGFFVQLSSDLGNVMPIDDIYSPCGACAGALGNSLFLAFIDPNDRPDWAPQVVISDDFLPPVRRRAVR